MLDLRHLSSIKTATLNKTANTKLRTTMQRGDDLSAEKLIIYIDFHVRAHVCVHREIYSHGRGGKNLRLNVSRKEEIGVFAWLDTPPFPYPRCASYSKRGSSAQKERESDVRSEKDIHTRQG